MQERRIDIRTIGLVAGLLVALCVTAAPSEASVITWNTCKATCTYGLSASGRTTSGSGDDRVYTFDAIGDPSLDLVARAFQTESDLGTGLIEKTRINIFTGGVGAGYESSPQHAVDNVGPDELIVFQLPENGYVPESFSLGWRSGDADVTSFIGGTLGGADDALSLFLSGGFMWDSTGGDLTSVHGYVQQTFSNVPENSSQMFTNGASGAYLILAARNEVNSSGGDDGEDKFKINQIVAAQPTRVPEPGVVLFLGLALGALATLRRRND